MSNLTRSRRQVAKSAGAIAPTEPASKTARVNWTDIMNWTLIDYYLDKMKRYGSSSNGIKSQQWTAITNKFNMEFRGVVLTSQQIQSNWQYMKTKWRINYDLRNKSGFGWDVELQNSTVTRMFLMLTARKPQRPPPFGRRP